jgi:hypothetical protein
MKRVCFSVSVFYLFSFSQIPADCLRINFHNPRRETQQNRFLGVKKEINENQTTWTGCDPYFGGADICRPAWLQERICNHISTRAWPRTCKTGSSSIERSRSLGRKLNRFQRRKFATAVPVAFALALAGGECIASTAIKEGFSKRLTRYFSVSAFLAEL